MLRSVLRSWKCLDTFRSLVLTTPRPRLRSTPSSHSVTSGVQVDGPGTGISGPQYGNRNQTETSTLPNSDVSDLEPGSCARLDSDTEWSGDGHEEVPVSDQKSLKVAIVGAPNAGKSTLINQLIQKKVLAVSPKVHTTCRRALGIFMEGNSQIVLMDTPGVIPTAYARKLKMSREFTADPIRSVMEADLVLVLVDAANRLTRERLDVNVLQILRRYPHLPSILVLNKVDIVKKKYLLLKLAHSLTASDQQDVERLGYLVRKSRDARSSPQECAKARQELARLRAESASRKEARRQMLDHLRARAGEPGGGGAGGRGLAEEEEEDDALAMRGTASSGRPDSGDGHGADSAPPGVDHAPSGDGLLARDVTMDHWPYFDEVFMVSAQSGDGVTKLRDYLISSCKKHKWDFSPSDVTDQPAINIVENVVREKIALHTSQELPYVVKQENVIWERDGDVLTIYQNLRCGKKSRAGILVGSRGSMIHKIREEATQDLEELFQCSVDLSLHVKV